MARKADGNRRSTGKTAATSQAPKTSTVSDHDGIQALNLAGWIRGLLAVSVLAILADLFVHKHSNFTIEYLFGFYGFFGFLGAVVLIIVAKGVQSIVTRPESYYDR